MGRHAGLPLRGRYTSPYFEIGKPMRLIYYPLIFIAVFLPLIEKPRLAFPEEEAVRPKIHLNLEQAVDLAFRNNRTLMFSGDSVQISQYGLESAKSEFEIQPVPTGGIAYDSEAGGLQQNYGMDVTKKLKEGTIVGTGLTTSISSTQKASDLNFSITQPLLRGFGRSIVTNSLVDAERSTVTTQRFYELTKEGLAVDVIRQYYEIIKQQKIFEINETALKREKIVLESAKARLAVGLASRLDVSRAEIQVQQAEENLINARQNLGNVQDSFKVLLNLPVNADLELVPEIDYPPLGVVESEAIATSMNYRLDLIEASDQIWDTKRDLKVAKNNILPGLDLVLGYTLSGAGDTVGSSFGLKDSGILIGFQTSATNLNRKRERASYKTAQINVVSRQRAYNLLVDTIIREVRDGIRTLENRYKNIPIQKKALDEAKSGLDVANERYKRNLADNFDIVNAETSLLRAEVGHITAITDYIVEHVRFRKTVGTLTEKPEILLRRHEL